MAILLPEISEKGGELLDTVVNFARSLSIWPVTMGLAYCAIEVMIIATPRFDIARFGSEVFHVSSHHADMILVSGRVGHKIATIMRDVYDEMTDLRWVISIGTCASSGGTSNSYAIIQSCGHVVPVDICLSGYPSCPEMLLGALLVLRDHIKKGPLGKCREEAICKAKAVALKAVPTSDLEGLMVRTKPRNPNKHLVKS